MVLRWLYQRDIVTLAKSVRPEQMQQNLAIDDFNLSEADLKTIAGLDEGSSPFFNHEATETVDFMKNLISQRRNKS